MIVVDIAIAAIGAGRVFIQMAFQAQLPAAVLTAAAAVETAATEQAAFFLGASHAYLQLFFIIYFFIYFIQKI